MTTEEILNQKADYLIKVGLIGYIETTDDTYKKALLLIDENVNEIDLNSYKVKFLDRVISDLEHYKREHQKDCPERKKENAICQFELHYNEVIKFCNKRKKELILEQSMMSFEDKIELIFKELATRPNRQGNLEEILNACDIPFIQNDLQEYIRYFKETGYVYTGYITKDNIDIVLNQKGLDFLKGKHQKQSELIINIGENYQNSIIAKGSHINQSVESSINPFAKNKIINKNQAKSEPVKSIKLQKKAIIVTIIIFVLGCLFTYLINKGII